MTPEGRIESYFVKQCKAHGLLCYKFTAPSTAGVPDRIAIGNGRTVFVELKAPGEKPRALQRAIHRQIQAHGGTIFVIDTKDGVDDFIHLMTNKQPTR